MGEPIRIALAGVGNCASALVQGLAYYAANPSTSAGLITPMVANYAVSDITVVAAFDVDARKVGRPLEDAIFAAPNCAQMLFDPRERRIGPTVLMAPVLDGIAPHMADWPEERSFRVADVTPVDVASVLRETRADVLVNYVPVGAEQAAFFFADACLESGTAMVNAMPAFIASDKTWAGRFEQRGIPIVGDDVKSQVGATILHRTLCRLIASRGAEVRRTYQLNFGGNTDFLNMLDRSRLLTKKKSKTRAVTSELAPDLSEHDVHVGPSDYVAWLDDQKTAIIRLEATGFAGASFEIDVKLAVQDSPNSAGVVVDAIRYAKWARSKGLAGPLAPACALYMKSPPMQQSEDDALQMLSELLRGA